MEAFGVNKYDSALLSSTSPRSVHRIAVAISAGMVIQLDTIIAWLQDCCLIKKFARHDARESLIRRSPTIVNN